MESNTRTQFYSCIITIGCRQYFKITIKAREHGKAFAFYSPP